MRLILQMQYPTSMRYAEWWFSEFPVRFKKYFEEIVILGKKYISKKTIKADKGMFSPIREAIDFELEQVKDYCNLTIRRNDDIFFSTDLSFPGMFANILYHKKPYKCFSYCHATSLNFGDYFDNVRHSKFPVETGHSLIFDKVFVGSEFHKKMLGWKNIEVVALPKNPYLYVYEKKERINDIISVCRQSIQKTNEEIEKEVEYEFGSIVRKISNNWTEYKEFLSSSKVLLITSRIDTFNYSLLEAIQCGCIPVAPNNLCFPEILPKDYLYNSVNELTNIIQSILDGKLKVPEKLICQDRVDNFYDNIAKIMLENK